MQTLQSVVSHIVGLTAGILIVGGPASTGLGELSAQESREVTTETIEQWRVELSNWGRWGDTDELGTLNLITCSLPRVPILCAVVGSVANPDCRMSPIRP